VKGGTENGLALFAGGGGLELGLSLAIGEHYRPIAYVEREATSAAVLAANMERGWLDKAPVWDDITTFTGDVVSPLVDNIDIVTAGFPCQPWSVAGQRKGTDDERWLWPLIFRLVCEIRPRSIFLENVPGLLHGGIEHVLGDLASVGFDAEWASIRASDIGAPHRRERIFILANGNNARSSTRERGADGDWQAQNEGRNEQLEPARQSSDVADTSNISGQVPQTSKSNGAQRAVVARASGELAHSVSERGCSGDSRWKDAEHAFPPSPSGDWSNVPERFWPAVKPSVRGMANGMARGLARNDRLRILGNGVVPQQAALAYTLLTERLNNLR